MPPSWAAWTAAARWPSTWRSCSSFKNSAFFPATKAALAGDRGNKPLPLQLLIGPLGGDHADAQLLGQQPHGGQGVALLQLPADDQGLHLFGDLLVNGLSALVADDNVQIGTSFPGARAPFPRGVPRGDAILPRVEILYIYYIHTKPGLSTPSACFFEKKLWPGSPPEKPFP